jgi:hypothetical protein
MAITLQATPKTLAWSHFTTVATRMTDPSDGTAIDAFTKFDFDIPDMPPRTVTGQLALNAGLVIKVTPNARVWSGVAKTPALLSHEQFHYDVGIVTGRSLARSLERLRAPNVPALAKAMQDAVNLHFITRTGLLQRRYDLDTKHGAVAHYQTIWKQRMAACLANPHSDQIGGFFL